MNRNRQSRLKTLLKKHPQLKDQLGIPDTAKWETDKIPDTPKNKKDHDNKKKDKADQKKGLYDNAKKDANNRRNTHSKEGTIKKDPDATKNEKTALAIVSYDLELTDGSEFSL